MWSNLFDYLMSALGDTLQMVAISSLITLVAGIPLAVLMIVTSSDGLAPVPRFNKAAGFLINSFRATPFIILMVALIPITRFISGTTIGVWAAVVPLSFSATPFFARIVEVSLREVDKGLIEAALAMGCRRRHIVQHVLLPEAFPGIVGGFTITIVSIIGASAMAGAIGAGGLGDLAIRYGYQRFDTQVMLAVIVVLIALVTLIQTAGDRCVSYLKSR